MADKVLFRLLRRSTLLRSFQTLSSYPKCSFSSSSSSHALVATATADGEEEIENATEESGIWLTLPPFFHSSSIDPPSLGKRIFDRLSFDSTEQEGAAVLETAPTTTTALKWVLRCCPHLPRCLVQKLFRLRQVRRKSTNPSTEGHIQQHRRTRVSAKDAMNSGDQIYLPITVRQFPSEETTSLCNDDERNYINSLELYKDSAIIVLNKPPGMPVQGGIGISRSLDMLAATSLRYDCLEIPRLVHRLDRDSSGILVMGRTQTSAAVLHSIFCEKTTRASFHDGGNTERALVKKYWALVIGTPRRSKGLISAPLARMVLDNGKSERITSVHDARIPSAQHALTEYKVIRSSDHGYTWLELQPLTGRKHQLRVHCAEVLGTPIVGDYKYGWQSHRKWEPVRVNWDSGSSRRRKKQQQQQLPFGLDLESGSISEKQPRLHLHCRQMILPNVSLALQQQQQLQQSSLSPTTQQDLSKLERLNLVAPLPQYMQTSWNILCS